MTATPLPPVHAAAARDLAHLEALVKGRSVALVGNATSLFERRRPIDDHDVVIRINKGPFVLGEDGLAGRRTDILLVSGFRGDSFLDAAPHVVWMSPSGRDALTAAEIRRLYFYPQAFWQAVSDEIGARPSSGCMGIDLVSRMIGDGEMHLYGFDFWKTPTSYTGISRPGPHQPSAEEAFARARIRPDRIAV